MTRPVHHRHLPGLRQRLPRGDRRAPTSAALGARWLPCYWSGARGGEEAQDGERATVLAASNGEEDSGAGPAAAVARRGEGKTMRRRRRQRSLAAAWSSANGIGMGKERDTTIAARFTAFALRPTECYFQLTE